MTGNDVLFGEGQDDDIYGGTGYDRIYGGTGTGRHPRRRRQDPTPAATARPSRSTCSTVAEHRGRVELARPVHRRRSSHHRRAEEGRSCSPPGPIGARNDIIYGGLGDDFLHGGAGDDAISGAEALREFYNEASARSTTDPLALRPGDDEVRRSTTPTTRGRRSRLPPQLRRVPASTRRPASRSTSAACSVKSDDGRDRIFGDNGNDWLVGGTNCDWLFGGFGDDLLNLDDNLETNGGRNDEPEDDDALPRRRLRLRRRRPRRADRQHRRDRMFDWHGEFNSFVVPFARSAARPSTATSARSPAT